MPGVDCSSPSDPPQLPGDKIAVDVGLAQNGRFSLLWEGKKSRFHDFLRPNRTSLTGNEVGRFVTEIVKPIPVKGTPNATNRVWERKNMGQTSILQKSGLGHEESRCPHL